MAIDEKDRQILRALERDAKLSSQKIADLTGIPITTVHYRVKNLRKTGVIKGQTIKIDYEKIDRGMLIYVTVFLNIERMREKNIIQKDIEKELLKIENIEKCDHIMSTGSFMLQVRVKDQKEYRIVLQRKIHAVDGIRDTQSVITLLESERTQ